MKNGIKISELKYFGFENIKNIVDTIDIILKNNNLLKNKILKIKENLNSVLESGKKSKQEETITCEDIDNLTDELNKIKYKQTKNNIDKYQIEYVIKVIQEIRKEIFFIIIKKNNILTNNLQKTQIRNNSKSKKEYTSTIDMLSKVNSANELMIFYKKKLSSISASKNLFLLKSILEKFTLYEKDIDWNTINKNRLKKINGKIKEIENLIFLSKKNLKSINTNTNTNTVKINNDSIKTKNEELSYKKIRDLLLKSINRSNKIGDIVGIYNDMLDNDMDEDKVLYKAIKNKLELSIKDKKKFRISDIRGIQRILFFTGIESNVIVDNDILDKKINKSEEKIESIFTMSKFEKRAESFLENNFKTLKIKHQIYYKGIEMDIFIPELNLNIEIDGDHHYIDGKLRNKDIKRDKCFKKDGIIVERIKDINYNDLGIYLTQIIEKYNKKEKTIKEINQTAEIKNIKDTKPYEDKILNRLGKVKNPKKLNYLYLNNITYLENKASDRLLMALIKKMNTLRDEIEWSQLNLERLYKMTENIRINNKKYKIPDSLSKHIEKNKTD